MSVPLTPETYSKFRKNCVYASTKEDNTIRYLSLNDNSYIRYFRGHKGLVTSLEVSPLQDVFCSASLDDTIKLWDTRTSSFQASIPSEKPSYVAFDPSGLVIAVASEATGKVELRDAKQFDAMPFQTCQLPKEPIPPRAWPDTGSACFSPDGRFVFAGNGDGKVALWDLNVEPGQKLPPVLPPISKLIGDTKPRMCAFNPKHLELITADTQLVSTNKPFILS
ncbi:unnamed protein product [Wickerhamomyces anomalus]